MQITAQESFWDFSNRVYHKPKVRAACLTLQDSYGLDVNLLLFACWHAHGRGLFERDMLKDALAFSAMWADNVVKPLRGARSWMKTNTAAADGAPPDREAPKDFHLLREQIKTLELQCEKFQENMLESLVKKPQQLLPAEMRIAAAVYNLRYIVEASAHPLSREMSDSLALLVMQTLDQPDDEQIRQAISRELAHQEA